LQLRAYSGGVQRVASLLPILVCLLACPPSLRAQEAVYVIRHAERADQSADPPLSTEGVARALRLRELLRDAGITRILTSELRRTRDTAGPLAEALHLAPASVPAADTAALAAMVSASGDSARVLVVGHSNTVPALLRSLGVTAQVAIADDEYDNLFIVVRQPAGRPVLVRLRY
jgi:broad specificity phosphatase PhoE